MFSFTPGPLGARGRCIYRLQDRYLIYTPSGGYHAASSELDHLYGSTARKPNFYVVLEDYFELEFYPPDIRLQSFAAYTPNVSWHLVKGIAMPRSHIPATMTVNGAVLPDESIVSGTVERYEVTGDGSTLRVVLDDEGADIHYEVLEGVIVGVRSGSLAEIVITHLTYE